MKNKIFGLIIFIAAAILLFLNIASADIIPADRRINWNAGLDPEGGIPNYASVTCTGLHNDNSVDDTVQINTCIANAAPNTAVFIPAGVYRVNGDINMKSNVVLRGAGSGTPWLPAASSGTTTLNMNGGKINFYGGSKDTNWSPGAGLGTNITNGYTKDSTTLTLSSVSGYNVGDYISIFQDDDPSIIDTTKCSWCGEDNSHYHTKQQYAKILTKDVSTNVITISPPVYYITPNPTGAQIRKQTFNISKSGIEDLKLNGNGSNYKLIWFNFALYCWAKNVETYNTGGSSGFSHIEFWFSHGCEVRDSYVHHGSGNDSGANYGIFFLYWNSGHKVENNIIRDTRHSIIFEGGGSGCAILYNYSNDNWESVQGSPTVPDTFLSQDLTTNHGPHPHMNLFEGNISSKIVGDYTMGSSSHNTLFRNYVMGKRDSPLPFTWAVWAIDIDYYNRYYNIIGNVIGQPSWTNGTLVANGTATPTEPTVYRFGSTGTPGSFGDGLSYSTALISGNYDYLTKGVANWSGTDHSLSSSLYYNSKPAFFGGMPWPPIGPDVTPVNGDIPAKLRYEGLVVPPSSTGIIPADRMIDWSQAGVPGGIPTNRTISATLNPGDNIQAALDNCPAGQVVKLNPGTYILSSALKINKGITLRGSGPDKTILKYTTAGGDIIDIWNNTFEGPKVALFGSWLKGAPTTFTVTSATGLSAGTTLVICQGLPNWVQVNGANGNATWLGRNDSANRIGQIVRIISIVGNNITVDRPAYLDYTISPQYMVYGTLSGAGVEDLALWRSTSSGGMAAGYNIYGQHTDSCWIKNVKSTNTENYHFYFYISSRCEINHCSIDSSDSSFSHDGDRSYGVNFNDYNTDDLMVNSIAKGCRHSVIFQGGVSGTVIAYNYTYAGYQSDNPHNYVYEDIGTHSAFPFFNLFEGNYCANIQHDNTFGASSYNTTFRCYLLNDSTGAVDPKWGRTGYKVMSGSWYNSIVGSVIGQPGDTSAIGSSYTFGWWDTGIVNPQDANVAATTYVHGSYDFIGNQIIWDPGNSNHAIPNSLYLNSKPDWFGDRPWPPVDPNNPTASSAITNIPAGYRVVYGVDPPSLLYGDVNSDGQVTAYDAALTAEYVVGINNPDFKNAQAADVDGSGSVTVNDVALIAQRAVGNLNLPL